MNLAPQTGADDRIRTGDPLITNEMLYQLSYVGLNTIELLKIYQVWQWSKSNMVIR